MKRLFLLFVVFYFQHNITMCVNNDHLPLIEITNDRLLEIIDRFLKFEKTSGCYGKDYFYIISFNKYEDEDEIYFGIEGLGPYVTDVLPTDRSVFIKNGNTFFIKGEMPRNWYKTIRKKQKLDLYQLEEGIFMLDLDLTRWFCWFKNGGFSVLEIMNVDINPAKINQDKAGKRDINVGASIKGAAAYANGASDKTRITTSALRYAP
jgi:hypothetical protein